MEEIMNNIYSALLTVGVSIVAFFVKRSFDSLDKKANKTDFDGLSADIKAISRDLDEKTDKTELVKLSGDFRELRRDIEEKCDSESVQKLSEDIGNFRREYATKEELKELRSQMNEVKASVEFLKENAVRKSDFVRVTADITSKIDDLSSYLRGKL